jgi:hypothetical protein
MKSLVGTDHAHNRSKQSIRLNIAGPIPQHLDRHQVDKGNTMKIKFAYLPVLLVCLSSFAEANLQCDQIFVENNLNRLGINLSIATQRIQSKLNAAVKPVIIENSENQLSANTLQTYETALKSINATEIQRMLQEFPEININRLVKHRVTSKPDGSVLTVLVDNYNDPGPSRAKKQLIDFLIDQPDIDMSVKGNKGRTAFQMALDEDLPHLAKRLVEQKTLSLEAYEKFLFDCYLDAVAKKYDSVADYVARRMRRSLTEAEATHAYEVALKNLNATEALKLLSEFPKIDINALVLHRITSRPDGSALTVFVDNYNYRRPTRAKKQLIDFLIDQPDVDLSIKGNKGRTAFQMALDEQLPRLAKRLIEQKNLSPEAYETFLNECYLYAVAMNYNSVAEFVKSKMKN